MADQSKKTAASSAKPPPPSEPATSSPAMPESEPAKDASPFARVGDVVAGDVTSVPPPMTGTIMGPSARPPAASPTPATADAKFVVDVDVEPRDPRRALPHGMPVLFAFAKDADVVERLAFVMESDDELVADLVVLVNGPRDRELLEHHERSFAHVVPTQVWRPRVAQNPDPSAPKAGTWREHPRF
jgi:hypothetical protein